VDEENARLPVTRIVVRNVVVGFKLNENKLVSDYGCGDAQHQPSGEEEKLFPRQSDDIVIHFLGEPFYLE
jgi:hypothetical protein